MTPAPRVPEVEREEERLQLSPLSSLLVCIECRAPVIVSSLSGAGGYPELGPDGVLSCRGCDARYPIIGGTARMLPPELRGDLAAEYPRSREVIAEVGWSTHSGGADAAVRLRTAESFAYEWQQFGEFREEWRKNFLDYLRPHPAGWFADRRVLDVGTGSGRHSAQAAQLGAEVVAVDLGQSIDVARGNLPPHVLTVQADAENLPFAEEQFDLVMSIGVLHHLPDPERAFRAIVPRARRGGYVQIYLYWHPPRPAHRAILRLVTALRRATTRMPHRVLHLLCYPLAALLWVGVVVPHRELRHRPRSSRIADLLPLKTYADYPFGVCVNDQFDRFSAPIEHRYEADEVERWLTDAGLETIAILPNHGWLAAARRR